MSQRRNPHIEGWQPLMLGSGLTFHFDIHPELALES
jgi:hypothetical protein